MNPEQNPQGQEQIKQEQTVETPKGPETVEDLKSQVDTQKQQLQEELQDIITRSKEWSAKQQRSEVDPATVADVQTELSKLDQEAQTTVTDADAQLDKLTTDSTAPDQEGTSEKDIRERAKISFINQKVQEMIAKHPDASQESIDATRKQFEKIVNIDVSGLDSGINRLYAEEYEKNAAHWTNEKTRMQQELQSANDPETRHSIEASIAEAERDIQYFNSAAAERRAMIDGSTDGKATDTSATTIPTMEQGKSYVGAKKNPDGSIDMKRALEVNDNVAERAGEEIKFESGQIVSLKRPESDVLEAGWKITEIQDADYGKYITASSPDGKTEVSMPASELSKYNQATAEQPATTTSFG